MTPAGPIFDRALLARRLARTRGHEPNVLTRTIAEEVADKLGCPLVGVTGVHEHGLNNRVTCKASNA